jgi:aromatic ring-opening dioxygenase catalytic subunit (LigB family)
LIVGSGMSFHNMGAFRSPAARAPSAIFDASLTAAVEAEPATRWDQLSHWAQLPAARQSHPREEHLLPLMVAAGAGGDSPAVKAFGDNVMMADISAYRFG